GGGGGGGGPGTGGGAAAKFAPRRQGGARSRSTRRGDHAVEARWYGMASSARCTPAGVRRAASTRRSRGEKLGAVRVRPARPRRDDRDTESRTASARS